MTQAQLVLGITAALGSLHLSAELHPDLKDSEVVRPLRLHTHHQRHAEFSHTDTVSYRLEMKETNIDIHLRRSRSLIGSDYTETHYTTNGTMVTVAVEDQAVPLCYYHGWVGDDLESMASISTCKGIRGFFRTENQDYMIEPLSDSETGDHVVFRPDLLKNRDFRCGVTNETMDSAVPKFNHRGHSQHRSAAASQITLEEQKYIETYLVVDNSEFQNMGRDMNKLRTRMFEIVNFVNVIYRPLNTFIALVGLEVWSDRDKINVAPPAEQTLSAFNDWRNNELNKIKPNDNAHLISAVHFKGVVGLAYVGSLCSKNSTTLIQDTSSNAMETAVVLSHELGHNLGMSHDTSSCSCSKAHCIMGATLSAPPPQHFSSCSQAQFVDFLLSSHAPQCLLNKPNKTSVLPPAVCGNGFVEEGEECDCSLLEECTDPWCSADASSAVSKCKCCKNCKFLPLAAMCRDVRSECDLPEYCSGESSECPEDTFRANGVACRNNTGYCYGGQCPLRQHQCTSMWGQTAETASDSCYELNMNGTQDAYCIRPSPEIYIGCQAKDVTCGKLFCVNGSDVPRYGTAVKIGPCKTTVCSDPSADYGQVQTGTKCGMGRVCSNSTCVDLEAVYEEPKCRTKCPEHAVCNNKAECQCMSGWAPPDCVNPYADHITADEDPGPGLSNKAYTAIGVCLTAILSIVIVTTALVWRIKTMKQRYTSDGARLPAVVQKHPVPTISACVPAEGPQRDSSFQV
ncbi:zinc metalloproteinase-disintegrin-like MTP9 isoform X1 [Brachyhypopomus gauderio]|uniref:zinc metalloproteinase-disintegrin-like MTP9 isoform X1 n=1 Tax=Brachyhypopomus gauderio TaxID=698409 RepID=UPI0040437BAD